MAQLDMPIGQIRSYRPELAVPADLEQFWKATLAEARAHDLGATFTRVDSGLTLIDTYDVSYAGFGGSPVRAWLHLPAGSDGPRGTDGRGRLHDGRRGRLPVGRRGRLPVVVEYVGYGGGRGLAHERILWAAAGYAHFVMDTRGQGSGWAVGDTPDPDASGAPSHPGFMTQGILDPKTYYYRRIYTDAVRGIEAARAHPEVDPTLVAVTGASQGGGISLAMAGLVEDLSAVAPDVPFLCDFPRATTFVDTNPYAEVAHYLKAHRDYVEQAYATLSYFDGAILGRRAVAPALFSVGLMDQICPPSTVYAAFNYYAGPAEIREYPFNDHEGGGAFHDVVKMRWLGERLRA